MNTEVKTKPQIDWVTTLFLLISPLVGIFGTLWYFSYKSIHAQTWYLFAFFAFATGMGITVGYHRLFSHKSYEASSVVKLWLLLFGAAAFQSSALEWSEDHRIHHKFVDTDKDPYSIKKGFWYAHIGWLFQKRKYTGAGVTDLANDPMVAWQHKHFYSVSIFMCFFFPGLLTMIWGDFWEGVFVVGFLRLFLVHQFTFFINSACHMWGARTFSKEQTARDNWFIAFFTFGEGYHNFHHEFQSDYRNGIRWYDYDPSKWMIKLLSYLRLTWNLKTVSEEKILQKTMFLQEKETLAKNKMNQDILANWETELSKWRELVLQNFIAWKQENLRKDKSNKQKLKDLWSEFQNTKKKWEMVLQEPTINL